MSATCPAGGRALSRRRCRTAAPSLGRAVRAARSPRQRRAAGGAREESPRRGQSETRFLPAGVGRRLGRLRRQLVTNTQMRAGDGGALRPTRPAVCRGVGPVRDGLAAGRGGGAGWRGGGSPRVGRTGCVRGGCVRGVEGRGARGRPRALSVSLDPVCRFAACVLCAMRERARLYVGGA